MIKYKVLECRLLMSEPLLMNIIIIILLVKSSLDIRYKVTVCESKTASPVAKKICILIMLVDEISMRKRNSIFRCRSVLNTFCISWMKLLHVLLFMIITMMLLLMMMIFMMKMMMMIMTDMPFLSSHATAKLSHP